MQSSNIVAHPSLATTRCRYGRESAKLPRHQHCEDASSSLGTAFGVSSFRALRIIASVSTTICGAFESRTAGSTRSSVQFTHRIGLRSAIVAVRRFDWKYGWEANASSNSRAIGCISGGAAIRNKRLGFSDRTNCDLSACRTQGDRSHVELCRC